MDTLYLIFSIEDKMYPLPSRLHLARTCLPELHQSTEDDEYKTKITVKVSKVAIEVSVIRSSDVVDLYPKLFPRSSVCSVPPDSTDLFVFDRRISPSVLSSLDPLLDPVSSLYTGEGGRVKERESVPYFPFLTPCLIVFRTENLD